MKKVIIICIAFVLTNNMYAQKNKIDHQLVKKTEKKWTMEQVKSIAAKYNLQNHRLLTESKNSSLMYSSKEEIEDWCQLTLKFDKEAEGYKAHKQKAMNIRTLEDYFNHVDSYPPSREAHIKAFGGEAGMNKWRNELRTCKNWRIYISNSGGLALREGDKVSAKEESLLGKRIDNLPKF